MAFRHFRWTAAAARWRSRWRRVAIGHKRRATPSRQPLSRVRREPPSPHRQDQTPAKKSGLTRPWNLSCRHPSSFGRKQVTAQFPDKTPQSTWNVKVYSDGSEVYDGLHTEFYFNGNKLMEGTIRRRKAGGEVEVLGGKRQRDQDRNVIATASSTVCGPYFATTEAKSRDVGYKNGKRDGKWIFYDAAGKNQPLEQHEYKADDQKTVDNPDGTWIKWYPDGKKQSGRTFHERPTRRRAKPLVRKRQAAGSSVVQEWFAGGQTNSLEGEWRQNR